jgi:PAS domain-containing protein
MSDQILFSIGEVASIVGLSQHTIRAWERRYGLLQPLRTPSGQRRYTVDDVALLLQVKHSSARHGLSLKVATRSAQGELSIPALEDPRPAPGGVIGDDPAPDRQAYGSIWRSAANMLPQLIVILDIDGFVITGNSTAWHVLRVAADQMVGRRFTDLLGDPAGGADVRVLLQRGYVQPSSFELDLRWSEGVGRWCFDCRPFSYEGQPRLAVFGRESPSPSKPD